jgi:hypothetical protein
MTDSTAAAEATLPLEYLTDVELEYLATKIGLTTPDGGRLPRAGEMTAEGVLDLGVKLNNAVLGKSWVTLAPPSVVEAATNLREAQKAYMADRGNNELGAAVGKCSAYLDRALKAHAAYLAGETPETFGGRNLEYIAYHASRAAGQLSGNPDRYVAADCASLFRDIAERAARTPVASLVGSSLRSVLEERAALCREDARAAAANNYRYTSEPEAARSLAEAAEIDALLAIAAPVPA